MSLPYTIIDMRSRPPFLHPYYGQDPHSPQAQRIIGLNRRLGSDHPQHFLVHGTSEAYVEAIRHAGIARAVVVGRSRPNVHIRNDWVKEMVDKAPEILIGIASIDPLELGIVAALEEIKRAIMTLHLAGISLEPAFLARPLPADSAWLFPLYELCSELNVPVFFMTGPTVPNLHDVSPEAFAVVAGAFPHLRLVISHGAYPFVKEMIGTAFAHENIFISP
ncbi:MAG: amidohydrolase family protein, partial [Firmicutes bacterium]|nr:amidohydrolase family protein [Bacillota bacterium]